MQNNVTMKKNYFYPYISIVATIVLSILLCGCVKEVEQSPSQEELHEVIFHAGWAPETKTVLQEDGSVWWSPGDEISLFYGNGESGEKLTSINSEPSVNADFVGRMRESSKDESYVAIYPYCTVSKYDIDNQVIYVTIPSVQYPEENSFDKNALISVAVSDDNNLYFRNACGGIVFSFYRDDIKEVVIQNNWWHYCSGPLKIQIVDGNPIIDGKEPGNLPNGPSPSNKVRIVAPDNGTFNPDKKYYAVLAPNDFSDGLSVTYKTEDSEATLSLPAGTISRGVFKKVLNRDKDLLFHSLRGTKAELGGRGSIGSIFDDVSMVKQVIFNTKTEVVTEKLVSSDGDYPVYAKREGGVVNFYTEADSYHVQNPDWFFQDFISLESIDLSSWDLSTATSFQGVFENCQSLTSIEFGDIDVSNVKVFVDAFSSCRSLTSLDLSSFHPDKVENMNLMFHNCSKLTTLDLSTFSTVHVTEMVHMFSGCKNLDCLNLSSFSSESLKSVFGMFSNCFNLTKLNLGKIDLSTVSDIHAMCMGLGQISRNLGVVCVDNTRSTIINNIGDTHLPHGGNHITWLPQGSDLSSFERIYDPSLYYSKDFTKDGEVLVIQSCTEGNGVDLVFVGEAYSDRLIDNGKYLNDVESAINDIFSHEPFATYKYLFNIYAVNVVSENEVLGQSTALCLVDLSELEDAGVNYDDEALTDYVFKASDKRDLNKIAKIVLVNSSGRSVCISSASWNYDMYYDYPAQHVSTAFVFNRETQNVAVHEFGHAFACLADEYVDKPGFFEDWEVTHIQDMMTHLGWYSNVDFTSDLESIKWKRFVNDIRYSDERVSAYEGGFHYMGGIWRATPSSIMVSSGEFNAPSREAIYKRIHKLAYGEDWQFDYEAFVQQDLKNIPSVTEATSVRSVPYPVKVNNKPLFKMEESTTPDGKKMVTVIMD